MTDDRRHPTEEAGSSGRLNGPGEQAQVAGSSSRLNGPGEQAQVAGSSGRLNGPGEQAQYTVTIHNSGGGALISNDPTAARVSIRTPRGVIAVTVYPDVYNPSGEGDDIVSVYHTDNRGQAHKLIHRPLSEENEGGE